MGFNDKLLELLNKATDNEVKPGDDQQIAANPWNKVVDTIGLPDRMKQTTADYKQAMTDLPQNMAQGGRISGVGAAELASQKLEEAMAKGYKPSAAEMYALSKFKGTVPVIPDKQTNFGKVRQLLGGE